MKTPISFLALTILTLQLNAQNTAIEFKKQDKFRYDVCLLDDFAFDIGPSGPDVVFDFRNLETVNCREGDIMEDAKGSVFEHLYPEANYVAYPKNKSFFKYYRYTENAFFLIGSVDLKDSVYKYHAGIDTLMRYPMRYGDHWNFETFNIEKVNIEKMKNGKVDSAYSNLVTDFSIDASGKVLFPDSSEHDVVRMKTTVKFDSDAFSKGRFRFKKLNNRIRYSWFIPEFPVSEVVYYEIDSIQYLDRYGNVLDEKVVKKCIGTDPVFTDAESANKNALKILASISPNGWTLQYETEAAADATILLYESSGKLIRKQVLSSYEVNWGSNTKFIENDALAPGVYIIRLQIGEQADVIKVVKN